MQYFFFPFAIGNLLGPLVLGHLFDTIGRRKMILATYGLAGVIDENGGVVVEFDVRTVAAAALFHCADDDGLDHRALLDRSVRRRLFDRCRDDIAQARVLAGRRPAQHLDEGDLLRAGIVRNLKNCSHLNHG